MLNILERETASIRDGGLPVHQPGSPEIDQSEVADIITHIPDGTRTLPDVPFARYNILRMVDFLTRAKEGFGVAHLADRCVKTGELRELQSFVYFFKVMPYEGIFEEKESIISSTLNGMLALADSCGQEVAEEDISNAKAFLTSYALYGQKPGQKTDGQKV